MTSVRIRAGDIEPIVAPLIDGGGFLLTGGAIDIRIRRQSDLFYFDWADDTFKAFGSVGTPDQTLTELANSPGHYRLTAAGHVEGFNTGTIANPTADDNYLVTFTTATLGARAPSEAAEIHVDQWVQDIIDDTEDIQTRLPAALVGGAMDCDVSNMQAGTVTAAAVATDAIDADALATDGLQEIADHLETNGTNPHGTGAWDATATVPAQTIRDAMKLAPTGGAPAAGSVDEHLDDILTDTAAGGAGPWATATGFAVAGDAMTLTAPAITAVWDEDITGREASPDTAARIQDLQNKLMRGRIRTNPTLDRLELYDPVDDSLLLAWPLTDFGGGTIANVAGAPFDRTKAVET